MSHEVSVTELRGFKHCRRDWEYSHVQGLVKNEQGFGATWLGSAMHFALARFYDNPEVSPAAEFLEKAGQDEERAYDKAYFNSQVELGLGMLEGYVTWLDREQSDDWEVVGTEVLLKARLPGSRVILRGTLDLLVKRPDGKLWVVDHKTFGSFVEEASIETDDQMMLYMWLVSQSFDTPVAGAIYNMLRKKVPAEPYELKGGGLSKAKGIDTTYDIFLAAVERRGLDPNDYAEILATLKHNEFFRRIFLKRNQSEMNLFAQEAAVAANEMSTGAIYPNRGDYCKWGCAFNRLCRAESLGGDADSIRATEYTTQWVEVIRK